MFLFQFISRVSYIEAISILCLVKCAFLLFPPAEFPEGDHREHRAHRRADRVWRGSDPEKFTAGRCADRGRAGGAALLLPGGVQPTGPLPSAPHSATGELLFISIHM